MLVICSPLKPVAPRLMTRHVPRLGTPSAPRCWRATLCGRAGVRWPLWDEASRNAAQVRVEHAYGQMYSRGYFRDSYNDWNLLWKFGLSWWTDVIPMLNSEGCLAPEQAACLLATLKEREPAFKAALGKLQPRDQAYFRERYAELQQFLNEAIALKKPVVCSL